MLRNQNGNCEECGGARRYTVSAVLLVLLLGLLPAACTDPEGAAVSQGTPRSATEGSDPTEEQPRGDDMSEPDGEPSVQSDEPQGGGSGTRQVPPPSSGQ